MKALILSGGMGKRLKPITDYMPKALIPLDNTPIIEWQIRYFVRYGIEEFVICLGYKSEQIIDYFANKDLGVKIEYSIEKTPLGTGGAIKKAARYLKDDYFYVINGDVITNIDIKKLSGSRNSVAVIPLRTMFGLVHLAGDKIERFEEKPEIFDYWMNAGIYHLEKKITKFLPTVGNIENTAFPRLAAMGRLCASKFERGFWHSIDSHKDIEECTKAMRSARYEKFLFR